MSHFKNIIILIVGVPAMTIKSTMTATGKLLILIEYTLKSDPPLTSSLAPDETLSWNGNTPIFEQTWVNVALKIGDANESYRWVPSPEKE